MNQSIDIVLTDKQIDFLSAIETTENTFYGGARGGGKSHGLREIMLFRRAEIPQSKGVIFRRTYPELYANHIEPLMQKFPKLREFYNGSTRQITFPNRSILAFRHCQYEKDLHLYQGQEFHDLGIDEIGEWPEAWYWFLKGSNRSSLPHVKPRFIGAGNPGGIGHKWLKRLFITREFRENEKPEDYIFVPAMAEDNPVLMENDPGYISRLESNPNKMLVKAWRGGSWDLQAGQFFDMMDRKAHVIDPFPIPSHWKRFAAFDTGYNHPAGFLWGTSDTDGNVYIYREYAKSKRTTEEVVSDIMKHEDTKQLPPISAGWDCWVKASRGGGPSVDEKFGVASGRKLTLVKANIDRVPGATQVRDYLKVRENGPRLRIFKTCPLLFETLVRMMHDPDNPEDVLKEDATNGDENTGDDLYDTLRYMLMSRPRMSMDPPKGKRKGFYDRESTSQGSWTTT